MRIISGKYRGRVFNPPDGLPIRPTTDKAREGLFNILTHRFELHGIEALDLFAGAGGVTFELLSRGAARVVSVDKFQGCIYFIRDTLKILKEDEKNCLKADVLKYIQTVREKFDLIFADPPYDMPGQQEMIRTILDRKLLKPGGLFILEHRSLLNFEDFPELMDTRAYGAGAFSFFSADKSQI